MKWVKFQVGVFVIMKSNILITGTGSLIGQAIIKSINRSSIREKVTLIGCDYFQNTIGSFWCDKNYILPDLLDSSEIENWKKTIIDLIVQYDIRIIFIGVDFELAYFSELKVELKEKYNCIVIVSDKEVIDIGNDKYRTYEFLISNGIRAPKTYLLEDMDDFKLDYPFVLKPRVGARSRGVEIVKDSGHYDELYEKYTNQNYIAQEYIGTNDTEYTCGILYWDNKYIDSIILKRELKEGNTALAEFNGNAEASIQEYIKDIGNVLKPFGSCNLQLRTDKAGEAYLFEINPRFSGTTYIRALFGYNEVEFVICKIMGWQENDLNPRVGKVYRFFDERLL